MGTEGQDLGGEITPQGKLLAEGISPDGSVNEVRVANDAMHTSALSLRPDGSIYTSSIGEVRQGEAGSYVVATQLIQFLRRIDDSLTDPVKPTGPEGGVDFEAQCASGTIYIQVTRALPDQNFLEEQSTKGVAHRTAAPHEFAASLWQTIAAKQNRYGPEARRIMILAIDATEVMTPMAPPVLDALRGEFGPRIDGAGFRSIWVVGPLVGMAFRLDRGPTPY